MSTPITAATAQKLCAFLGISEEDALLAMSLTPPSADELAEMQRANLPALAAAFTPTTTEALVNDPKIELPETAQDITAAADQVRSLEHLEGIFSNANDVVHAASRGDCGTLSAVLSAVLPQIIARGKTNRQLKITYSSLLAYHHARYPGRGPTHAAPANPKPGSAPGTGK